MELHQLEYLVAVAEEGGFTKAAERLKIAQPSVSQQIKTLEQEVGRPLFDRFPRGVVLTEAGQRLLEHARRVLSEINDARRRVGEVGEAVSGSVTVGAIPTIAPYLLPEAVREFLERWPEVTFVLVEDVTAHLLDGLRRGELDLAILSSAEDVPGVHIERVAEEPLLLVAGRGHRLARRRKVEWADLREERLLVLHEIHCLGGQVKDFCDRQGVKPRIAAHGSQLSTIATMVSAGLGVSLMPEMFRQADTDSEHVYLPFAGAAPSRELCIARSVLRYRTNAARAFVEVVRRVLLERQPRGKK